MTVINTGFYNELVSPDLATQQQYPGTSQVGALFFSSWEDGCRETFENGGWSTVCVISREDYAEAHLGVDMIRYTFPDRKKSTELIIVMRCRSKARTKGDAGQAILRAALVDAPGLEACAGLPPHDDFQTDR